VALVAASGLLQVWIPRQLGEVADRLQRGHLTAASTSSFAAALLAIAVVRIATGWTGRVMIHRAGRVFAYELRRDLLRKWGTLSPDYYHRHGIGDLLSHALSDVEVIRDMVTMGVNVSVAGLSMLAAVVLLMAVHGDWRLTLAGVAPLLLIPGLVHLLGPRIRARSQSAQEALGRMAETVEEVVGGVRAVKAFGTERVMLERLEGKVDAIVAERTALAQLSSLFGALVPLLANVGFVVVLGFGGVLASRGAISLGCFVAFTLYVAILRHPLEQLGQVLNLMQRGAASLDRIAAQLRVVPAVRDASGELLDRPIRGALRVERLTFRYPGTTRTVLDDVSFTVCPGQTLGIVGPTGSGKTTLANLLLRLYDPPGGAVFVDGADILRYPLARLRKGVAYVPQDGFLFSTTLLENIGFSDETPDRERAVRCARITAVHDDIQRFPKGFDTEIGQRGVRLSGGQRQRVALARAAYKDAPLQILDDSLSAVDTITERRILDGLREDGGARERGRSARTAIVISHRLSAVQHAEVILVLQEGRVVQRGSHATLLSSGGAYAQLWRRQAGLDESLGAALNQPDAPRSLSGIAPGLVEDLVSQDPELGGETT
jgi:ATP-binding cassette subfamily B protein